MQHNELNNESGKGCTVGAALILAVLLTIAIMAGYNGCTQKNEVKQLTIEKE